MTFPRPRKDFGEAFGRWRLVAKNKNSLINDVDFLLKQNYLKEKNPLWAIVLKIKNNDQKTVMNLVEAIEDPDKKQEFLKLFDEAPYLSGSVFGY